MAARKTGAEKSGSAGSESEAAKSSGSAVEPPQPNVEERMEGVQGWMAEIERRQGRMAYFGAAAAALAVVAAGAALFLAVTTKNDAATKDDVDQLTEQVDGLKQEVTSATEKQLKATSETLGSLDQRLEALTAAQKQDAADIADLQSSSFSGSGKNSIDATGLGGGATANAGANRKKPGP